MFRRYLTIASDRYDMYEWSDGSKRAISRVPFRWLHVAVYLSRRG
ncbi:MAG TPA: hypothetical protein VGI70_14825 [Polyangiales bacterium]